MGSRQFSEMHIFPFFSKNAGPVKIEHFSLEDDKTELRGIQLEKVLLDSKECPIFYENKIVNEKVYYWKIFNDKIFDHFVNALNLTKKGLGF